MCQLWLRDEPVCGPPAPRSPLAGRAPTEMLKLPPELSLPHFLGGRGPQETSSAQWSLGEEGNMEDPEPPRSGVSLLMYLHSIKQALPG